VVALKPSENWQKKHTFVALSLIYNQPIDLFFFIYYQQTKLTCSLFNNPWKGTLSRREIQLQACPVAAEVVAEDEDPARCLSPNYYSSGQRKKLV
jgi:hypothetical protein